MNDSLELVLAFLKEHPTWFVFPIKRFSFFNKQKPRSQFFGAIWQPVSGVASVTCPSSECPSSVVVIQTKPVRKSIGAQTNSVPAALTFSILWARRAVALFWRWGISSAQSVFATRMISTRDFQPLFSSLFSLSSSLFSFFSFAVTKRCRARRQQFFFRSHSWATEMAAQLRRAHFSAGLLRENAAPVCGRDFSLSFFRTCASLALRLTDDAQRNIYHD